MPNITCLTMHDSTETDVQQPKVPQQEQPVASRTRRLSSSGSRVNFQDSSKMGSKSETVPGSGLAPLVHKNCQGGEPTIKKLAEVYQKEASDRSEQEADLLATFSYLLPSVESYLKSKHEKELLKQRLLEVEESYESIQAKADVLARLIKESKHVVIYTGAGISTSASIPDYRGPNGIWTQIRRTGSFSITKVLDLSAAEPTYTHMAIKELCRKRIVKHVVSQNCDGLHLRSGIVQSNLSEIHGNMYIEVCPTCERQYFREADVTQRTCRFRHKTGRRCHTCIEPNNNLIDTIVLYGERSRTKWPMNWDRASKAAKNADLIICMGSSLKTLRRYGCLWPASSTKKAKSETKLVIINLQHTSKDKNAFMKINGKCDLVMENVMQRLKIAVPAYEWSSDPLVDLSVPFTLDELSKLKRNLIFESRKYQASTERSSTPQDSQDDPSSSLSPSSTPSRKRPASDDNRYSPSLFVSELTDDPDKKRLRMRIRAVNVGAAASFCQPAEGGDADITPSTVGVKLESGDAADDMVKTTSSATNTSEHKVKHEPDEEHDSENLSQLDAKHQVHHHHHHRHQVEYAPPGWLGKSLGVSKSSSYRRKRHGNKGRKRTPQVTATTTAPPPPHPLPTPPTTTTATTPTTTPTTVTQTVTGRESVPQQS